MASRLPQLIRFAPAGAAGLGAGGAGQLGVGGGTTATATGTGGGLAVAGAKVVAAFAVGFGVGIGLAKAQEAVLPKGYTTPDLLARGFKAACGEPTQGFLDWGDKYLSWLP